MENRILLTFDLEEFDLPLEFGCAISEEDQINTTNNGLYKLIDLLAKYNVKATFFTTAFYASGNKELIRKISLTHEIASHSNVHSGFTKADLSDSKMTLEKITGKQINGFRMPRFQKVDRMDLKAAGYKYDSSVNPTFIPGRYNNFFTPRKLYIDRKSDLMEIPVSVSPVIRFPLFWLSFKNMPFSLYTFLCKQTVRKDSYLHLCFHPWEFGNLDGFKIPEYIKVISGDAFSERFERLIVELKKVSGFTSVSDFLGLNSGTNQ